jgi:cation transport regulator ChaC
MYVFGYGSLSAEALATGAHQVATLAGFVRVWNVAMDNSVDLPGYKYYVEETTQQRPAAHITFLNLAPQNGIACIGFLLPVDGDALTELDARERNYTRFEVTHQIRGAPVDGPVYAYLGTLEARERFATGVSAGSAMIARSYLDRVERCYEDVGLRREYRVSTRPPECRVADLIRVNLPAVPAPGPAAA